VYEIEPLDLRQTIREGLLVPDPDLTVRFCAPFLWRHIHSHPKGYPLR
jgi:hypothetical protein